MTQETLQQIQEAAEIFADKIDDGNRTPRQCAIRAYIEGATSPRQTQSPWHAIEDEPKTASKCIIVVSGTRHKLIQTSYQGHEHWQRINNGYKSLKWAYKEDLL